MPGRASSRRRCSGLYRSTYAIGSGRGPIEAHVARDHRPELWEFVEAARPQPPPERREAVLVGQEFAVGAAFVGHRAELRHHDRFAVLACTFLPEHDGRTVRPSNERRQR
jgi:hypothetical protein